MESQVSLFENSCSYADGVVICGWEWELAPVKGKPLLEDIQKNVSP